MARIWVDKNAEEFWIRAANGDNSALGWAFYWSSTKEGGGYWSLVARGKKPYTPDIIDRVKMMYVEWKMVGDTTEREDGDG